MWLLQRCFLVVFFTTKTLSETERIATTSIADLYKYMYTILYTFNVVDINFSSLGLAILCVC